MSSIGFNKLLGRFIISLDFFLSNFLNGRTQHQLPRSETMFTVNAVSLLLLNDLDTVTDTSTTRACDHVLFDQVCQGRDFNSKATSFGAPVDMACLF